MGCIILAPNWENTGQALYLWRDAVSVPSISSNLCSTHQFPSAKVPPDFSTRKEAHKKLFQEVLPDNLSTTVNENNTQFLNLNLHSASKRIVRSK